MRQSPRANKPPLASQRRASATAPPTYLPGPGGTEGTSHILTFNLLECTMTLAEGTNKTQLRCSSPGPRGPHAVRATPRLLLTGLQCVPSPSLLRTSPPPPTSY